MNILIAGKQSEASPLPPQTCCEAHVWKVSLPHFPPAWIQTLSLIPHWFHISFLLNSKVFLRGIQPNVTDYRFLKPLTQAISAWFLGLLSLEGLAVRELARAALDNAAFELLLVQLSAWQRNKMEINKEHEPKQRCSWYWWKRQLRSLWQRIIEVSFCVFPWWMRHCGCASSLFKHSQQHFFSLFIWLLPNTNCRYIHVGFCKSVWSLPALLDRSQLWPSSCLAMFAWSKTWPDLSGRV